MGNYSTGKRVAVETGGFTDYLPTYYWHGISFQWRGFCPVTCDQLDDDDVIHMIVESEIEWSEAFGKMHNIDQAKWLLSTALYESWVDDSVIEDANNHFVQVELQQLREEART